MATTPVSDPSLTPAGKPPPELNSNLNDPPSNGYITIIVAAIVISLTTPFVLLRMYIRQFINRRLWWDDYTCVLGWIFILALASLQLKVLDYGGGVDIWNVSKAHAKLFTEVCAHETFHDIEIIARVGMFFTKVAIVLLYHRLFIPPGSPKSGIFWGIWFVFWWNLLYAIALILTVTTQCVGKADRVARGKECLNQYAILISASVINVVSDLMILVIPIAAIMGLHMTTQQKIRVSAVFGVGSLGVLASVARLGYQVPEAKRANKTQIVMILLILKYSKSPRRHLANKEADDGPRCSIAEQMIGIIVACMPVLPALLPHLRGRSSQARNSGSNSQSIRKNLTNKVTGYRSTARLSRMQTDDPDLLHNDYEELRDLENRRRDLE
ncbi:MAG: hypothetical protein Q9217_005144 [Psora testacea]